MTKSDGECRIPDAEGRKSDKPNRLGLIHQAKGGRNLHSESHKPDRRTCVIIPPQKGAVLSPESVIAMQERNRHIRSINRIWRREWHLWSGFTKRSRVENVVHRYKAILGREMKARTVAGQRVETRLGCRILNKMAKLGMPESYRAA